jgi:hypothetical protein
MGAGIQEDINKLLEQARALLDQGTSTGALAAARLYEQANALAKTYGLGAGAQGEQLPLYQEAPSEREMAREDFDVDRLVANYANEAEKLGWEVAGQNFANELTRLQNVQGQADWAQQYAQNLAPPGQTHVFGYDSGSAVGALMGPGYKGVELPMAPYATPQEAFQAAQAQVPQAPQLQYQPQALQGPDLGQHSPFPQAQPFQMGGAQLPTPGGAPSYQTKADSLMQAIMMILGPAAGQIGAASQWAGARLPPGV